MRVLNALARIACAHYARSFLDMRQERRAAESTSFWDERMEQELVTADELAKRKLDNRLYNSWVNLTADDMIPQLLDTGDITDVSGVEEKTFVSALNSRFIKQIAEKTLTLKRPDQPLEFPPYVSKNLRAFVTLANLDGFKRELRFAGAGRSGFFMYDHRDVAMFSFEHKETYPSDGSIDVDFIKPNNTDLFVNAGMATGAFPIGLAYRTFSRHRKYIEQNILLTRLNGGNRVILDPNDILENSQYRATLIDGGTIDNEPFDLTRYLLQERVKATGNEFHSNHFSNFNSTVLMIDPFPSEDRPRIVFQGNLKPFSVLGAAAKLFSTVREQSMLKTEDVKKAISVNDCSRFLISPRRRVVGEDPIDGSLAIACGSLNGFGGFLDKDFRKHDFYLGRINCKAFLQKHFVVSNHDAQQNVIFEESYKDTAENRQIRDMFGYESVDLKTTVFPIIPDVNLIKDKEQDLDINDLYFRLRFPSYTHTQLQSKLAKYHKGIKTRLKAIVMSNVKDNSFLSIILPAVFIVVGRKAVREACDYVSKELARWDILKSQP